MGILIIGSGNGGLAFGARLIQKGERVRLYDKFKEVIAPIIENDNEIYVDGKRENIKFELVTDDLAAAVKGVNYIFVVTPAFAHESIAQELADCIEEHQIVILHPGRTGGALEFKRIFSEKGKENIIAETNTLLFACRKASPIDISIYGTKKQVGVAAIPSSSSQYVTDILNSYLPHFYNSGSVLSTSLSNIGAIFHPVPFLFNLSRVENKQEFRFYHEGITPAIANLLERLDEERLEIAKNFGLNLLSAKEWLNENYHIDGNSLYEAIQMNESYQEITAPLDVKSRYVMEDIPMGLVPIKELAEIVEMEPKLIRSIISLASTIYNIDFEVIGRNRRRMGLTPDIIDLLV